MFVTPAGRTARVGCVAQMSERLPELQEPSDPNLASHSLIAECSGDPEGCVFEEILNSARYCDFQQVSIYLTSSVHF